MNSTILNTEQDKAQRPSYFNDIFILALALIYTLLFYEQSTGVNYLIFSILVPLVFFFRDRQLIRSKAFLALSLGSIFTGGLCFYFGSDYHLFLNKISLLLLAGVSFSPTSSLIVAFFHSTYTYLSIPFYTLIDLFAIRNQPKGKYSQILKYGILSIIPIVIALLFLLIYSASNPILTQFLSHFNWSFISTGFVFFLFYAFLIAYGLMKQRTIKTIIRYDNLHTDDLKLETDVIYKSFFSFFSLKSEVYIAVAAFILLNLVIGLNNGLDIYYLFIQKKLPFNLSYTAFLHQGVNALISSIFLAIGLIMYFFSSRLNFVEKSNYIKLTAYLWILQNGVLVYLCFYKNSQYIAQFGLTYKRIGVYTFLVLATIGLGLTFYKIWKNKTNLFLLRKNTWVLYIVLVGLGSYDWDQTIAHYNLDICPNKDIDYSYLISLDHTAMPALYHHFFKSKDDYLQSKVQLDSIYHQGDYTYLSNHKDRFIDKLEQLKKDETSLGIQSYCLTRKNVINQLK